MAQTPIAVPYRTFTKEHLEGDMTEFNTWVRQVTQAVNLLAGQHGTIQLNDVLDMGGKQIVNVGAKKITLG